MHTSSSYVILCKRNCQRDSWSSGTFKTSEKGERAFREGERIVRVRGGCTNGRGGLEMKRNKTEGVPRSGNSFNPVSWSQDLAVRQLVVAGKSKRTHFALWYHNPNNHYYCRHLLNPKSTLPASDAVVSCGTCYSVSGRATRSVASVQSKVSFCIFNLFNYSIALEWQRLETLRLVAGWTNISVHLISVVAVYGRRFISNLINIIIFHPYHN